MGEDAVLHLENELKKPDVVCRKEKKKKKKR